MADPTPTPPTPAVVLPPAHQAKPDWNLIMEAQTADPTLKVLWDVGALTPNVDFQWTPLDEQHRRVMALFPSGLVKKKGTSFEIGALVAPAKNQLEMSYTKVQVAQPPGFWVTLVASVVGFFFPGAGPIILAIASIIGIFSGGVLLSSHMPGCVAPTPGPGPGPGPGPKPPPSPIPAAGLHVLIVYSDADKGKYTSGQLAALTGGTFRDLLATKCVMGPDGKTKEFRIWDATVDATNETALWQAAWKRPHASVPWIVLGNATTGFEGPLPAQIGDTIALVNKYGG